MEKTPNSREGIRRWDTALTVSFTGSVLISRDTSRLCNSCRQLSSITPGIPVSVSSVRGGNHGLPARRGQTPGFRVCQPLLHDPKPSGGERCCPSDFHLALPPPEAYRKFPQRDRCFMYQQDSCFYRGGGNFAWMIRRNNSKKNKRRILLLLARLIPFLSMRFRERLSIRMQMAGRDRIREKERKNGNEEREREVKTKTKDEVSRSVCAIITFI